MIKVLQICNKAPYPANDGSSIAIYNMAKGLMQNDVELHLLTINTKKHFKEDGAVPLDFKTRSHYRSVYRDTDTSAIGALMNLLSSDSYFVSRFYFKEFEEILIAKLKQTSFDVIQLEGLFMGVYLDAIRKNTKAKVVLRAHNVEYLIWERHIANEKNSIKRFYLKLQNKRLKKFEETVFEKVDAIAAITDADKVIIEKMNKKANVFTCITGVDLQDYELKKDVKKQENTLFYFGSMDWLPNQEAVEWFIANCWNDVLKLHPNCKFIIAGRNMPPKFKNINLPNVQCIENVSDNVEFYSKYDLMLVPLLSGSGLRIKIIEGLSFGKAIVSTSIGAEGIPVANGKELILADGKDAFIKAIDSVVRSPKMKNDLEAQAKNFAAVNLDNKRICSNLVQFYLSL